MTKNNAIPRYGYILGLAVASWLWVPLSVHAAEAKLEAVLVWATNGGKPEGSTLKPLAEDIAKRMNGLPFKYTNYFEVNRKQFNLPDGGSAQVTMSRDCKITVTSLNGGKVELTLIGKGQPVGKITQELKKGHCLVTGGNAQNSTAWFVVTKQID
jgi:hypothetical protein